MGLRGRVRPRESAPHRWDGRTSPSRPVTIVSSSQSGTSRGKSSRPFRCTRPLSCSRTCGAGSRGSTPRRCGVSASPSRICCGNPTTMPCASTRRRRLKKLSVACTRGRHATLPCFTTSSRRGDCKKRSASTTPTYLSTRSSSPFRSSSKKETKLLQTIDRLQLQASKENRTRKVETKLAAMAGEKKWGTVDVETPYTIRAKELRDLYNGLQMRGVSIDERLDVLLHIKWTVKEFDCPLTREIVDLIDREADLLNRGRRGQSLEGLRRRVSNLFLQFIETPEFNPEALSHTRVPLEYTTRPLVKLDTKR
eukprot:PhM_4_TR11599/c0_g1_i1/m.25150